MTRPVIAKRAPLHIAHCPLHGPSWAPWVGQRAVALGADSLGFSEGYHAVPWCHSNDDAYAWFTANAGEARRHDSRHRIVGHDVIIGVSRDHKVIAHGQHKICAELHVPPHGNKYHPERWAVWVLYRRADGLTVLDVRWHPQPGPLRHPRLVLGPYRRSVRRVQRLIVDLRRQHHPDVVVGGGDMQLGAVGRWIGPGRLFARLGMAAVHQGVDWLGWSRGWRSVAVRSVAGRAVGQDHPWLVHRIEPRR